MEDPNRFDLEKALRTWREDCVSRPGISFDDARELESDLRERVTDLLKQGLSASEAFRQAARQVGSPGDLAREFARENPWAVWRERLLWIVAAGFAISVWQFMTGGTIVWFYQTFGVLLPLNFLAWATLAANVPTLAIAVLLATGTLANLGERFQYFLQSRQRLGLTGVGLLATGLLIRLFGPSPLALPGSAGLTALFLLNLSTWPLLLLSIAVCLFRPLSARQSAKSDAWSWTVPAAVWRERVCWMAVGGLMVGFWQTVSWLGMKALFYTGDFNKPFKVNLVFTSVYLLIQLSPIMLLGFLLRQRMRRGKNITGGTWVRRQVLLALLPAFVGAWAGLYLWSEYLWIPPEFGVSLSSLATNYVTTFQWFWPVCLAALILWLAPNRSRGQWDSELTA